MTKITKKHKINIKQLENIYDILFNENIYPEARKEFNKWSKSKKVELNYTPKNYCRGNPYILIGKKFRIELIDYHVNTRNN